MHAPRFEAGLATINTVAADIDRNTQLIIAQCEEAQKQKLAYVLFPELSLTGYGLEDQFFHHEVADRALARLHDIAGHTKNLCITVGLPVRNESGLLYNAVATVADGKVQGFTYKEFLPNSDIYYEGRHFSEGVPGQQDLIDGVPAGDTVFRTSIGTIAPEICEDGWSPSSPGLRRALAGADIVANASASQYEVGKDASRTALFKQRSFDTQSAHLVTNLTGSETGRIVFDGAGHIHQAGQEVLQVPRFTSSDSGLEHAQIDMEEIHRSRRENTTWRKNARQYLENDGPKPHVVTIDADLPTEPEKTSVSLSDAWLSQDTKLKPSEQTEQLEELESALTLALVDYLRKNGAHGIKLPFSGGRDSALIGLIAARTARILQNEHDHETRLSLFFLKGPFTSEETADAAKTLAEDLQKEFEDVAITFFEEDTQPIQQEIRAFVARAREKEGGDYPEYHSRIADQNVQSRAMQSSTATFANQDDSVVLTTSNFSEIAVGYASLLGDLQGSYDPAANLPKTVINTWLEKEAATGNYPGIEKVLAINPSAELAEGQQDEEDLPPYDVQDAFHYLHLRQRKSPREIVEILKDNLPNIGVNVSERQIKIWVVQLCRLFQYAQYKRDQMPHGLKLFHTDLSPEAGLRWPVIAGRNEVSEIEQEILKEDDRIAEDLFPKPLDYA